MEPVELSDLVPGDVFTLMEFDDEETEAIEYVLVDIREDHTFSCLPLTAGAVDPPDLDATRVVFSTDLNPVDGTEVMSEVMHTGSCELHFVVHALSRVTGPVWEGDELEIDVPDLRVP